MTERKISVKVGAPIINNIYSGYIERVLFSGMPSKDSFCLTYQTMHLKENENSSSVISHDSANHIFAYERNEQLFLPLGYSDRICLPSRRRIDFLVDKVCPMKLEATLFEDQC